MRKTGISTRAIRGDNQGYIAYHAPRYAYLLEVLAKHGLGTGSTLLDIGSSRLTTLIHERFGIAVDSLGFGEDRVTPEGRHFGFDLNRAQRKEDWRRDLPRYDFVVMAEVLEHLYTAPQLVLSCVRTMLVDGGRLVLQTPNAASLPKRLKLLLGRNPFEMIRIDPQNPGHFREYTRKELVALAAESGFRVEDCTASFYFDARFAHHESGEAAGQRAILGTLKNIVYRRLPRSLREGITMVWRRSEVSG
jgi:cyclopropane fatty-acyl-phospholipid synthase-like methyltransferase